MNRIQFTVLCGLITMRCFSAVIELPITLQVVDEEGNAVHKAEAKIVFSQNIMQKPPARHTGFTDKDGLFSISQTSDGDVDIYVNASGYYSFHKNMYFGYGVTGELLPVGPENYPIEVVLKTIDNPVPMYVKELRIEIPILETPVGFDLEKADWCKPYGAGKNADLIMELHKKFHDRSEFDGSVKVTFSRKGDGIFYLKTRPDFGEDLRVPKLAPTTGYSEVYNKKIIYSSSKKIIEGISPDKDGNFIFRVRSVLDENGEIASANYGKIYESFNVEFRNTETAEIRFKYYFNPADTSRNLEFDPARNLFRDSKKYAP